jgi:hypothetical protein
LVFRFFIDNISFIILYISEQLAEIAIQSVVYILGSCSGVKQVDALLG